MPRVRIIAITVLVVLFGLTFFVLRQAGMASPPREGPLSIEANKNELQDDAVWPRYDAGARLEADAGAPRTAEDHAEGWSDAEFVPYPPMEGGMVLELVRENAQLKSRLAALEAQAQEREKWADKVLKLATQNANSRAKWKASQLAAKRQEQLMERIMDVQVENAQLAAKLEATDLPQQTLTSAIELQLEMARHTWQKEHEAALHSAHAEAERLRVEVAELESKLNKRR